MTAALIVTLWREAVDVELAHEATPALRRSAELLVELRSAFTGRDGRPDWRGRTYAYRSTVSSLLDAVDVDAATRQRLSDAVRYHVSIVLRERLDVDELDSYGLSAADAVERSRRQRSRRNDELARLRELVSVSDSAVRP